MKDIWLIDDNSKDQRRTYGASFVDDGEFSAILGHVERLNNETSLEWLDGCRCVLYHDSLEDYIDGGFDEHSHRAKEKLDDYLMNTNTPFVCFSDGHQAIGEYDRSGNIVSLKKSEFYNRFGYFLDQYQHTGVLQFHILAYGRNFKKELMARHVRGLFNKLAYKRPGDILKYNEVLPIKLSETETEEPYLEEIVTLAQPVLGITYDDLVNDLEDNEISVSEFRKRINKILNSVSQYGENNYTWE